MGQDAEGRVVFVPGTVPGDRVWVRPVKVKRRWARAELLEVLEPSPRRTPSPCEVQGRCGGCPWMLGDAALRTEQRLRIVSDEVAKVMGSEVAQRVPIIDGTPPSTQPAVGYRVRARWAFRRDDAGVTLGYRGERSHRIVPADDCAVVVAELRVLYAEINEALRGWDVGQVEGDVHALAGAGGVAGALIEARDGRSLRVGAARVPVQIAGATLELAPEGFSQANLGVTQVVWRWLRDAVAPFGPGHAVELFAGVGTFTTALLDAAFTVEAYDTHPSRRRWEGATFHRADLLACGVPLPPPERLPAVVLLDPPRSGAGALIDWIVGCGAGAVAYISCDLSTCIRDAQMLLTRGFELQQIVSFDMFPNTSHQEVAVLLRRVEGDAPAA